MDDYDAEWKRFILELEKSRSDPKVISGKKAAKISKALAAHFCGCSCHQAIQPGLVPCPRCEGRPCL